MSTSTQPMARSASKSAIVTPNAGRITTSSGRTASKSNVAARVGLEDLDPHAAQLRVHVRIVDDLADEQQAPVGELAPGLVGVLDRALHAVAEAELACEPDRDVVHDERVVVSRSASTTRPL